MDDSARRNYLALCLSAEIYRSFYCQGGPVMARWDEREPASADPWLIEAMSQANTGRGSWERGWEVEHVDDDDAVLVTERLRARVPVGDCRHPHAGPLSPGALAEVRVPKELPELSPGFFTVVSDAPADPGSWASAVRVYWNVARAGAPRLVRAVTSRLNREGMPFRLKVADHPLRLERCDAAVLYLEGEVFGDLRVPLGELATALRVYLRPRVPAFTLELAPGVGAAEDTSGGESFGENLCTLLADGIIRAHERGIVQASSRLDEVAARFAEDGVLIDAPYLQPSLAGRHVL
jgi:hypothetical protein